MRYLEIDCMNAAVPFAAEYYLLEEGALTAPVFMLWRTAPTLMLGRFQNIAAEINTKYAEDKGITLSRRKSGGGTIYTDPGGYQYSYVIPGADPAEISFRENSAAVVRALQKLGVPVEFGGRNDLLVDGRKISGTARYAGKNGIVHHGSLLFDTDIEEMVRAITVDDEKLIAKGIKSIRGRVTNIRGYLKEDKTPEEFKAALLELVLGPKPDILVLRPEEQSRVQEIRRDLFDSWEWIWGENPAYSTTLSKRFPGGKLELSYDSKNGRITSCSLTGDFFFEGNLDALLSSLQGCPLSRGEIMARLDASGQMERFFGITSEEIASLFPDSHQ